MTEKKLKPIKKFGQNFLNSPGAIAAMIKAGQVSKKDLVLEIGPGKGVLTSALLETGAKVIAIEKDRDLYELLCENFAKEIKAGRLLLINGDIRDFDLENIKTKFKLIANIPYYLTGEIIRSALSGKKQPELIVLLVQKEVAQRIVARDKKESILSISVKVFGKPKIIQTVKAGSFFPKPKVDSAILLIEEINRKNLSQKDEEKFFEILKTAFQEKRKTLRHSLKKLFNEEKLTEIFEKTKISPQQRPETLSPAKWLEIFNHLKTH